MTALSAEIQRLPLAQLVPSPFNARSVRTEARIAEDGQRKPMIGNKTAVRYKMLRNLRKPLIRIWVGNVAHLRDDISLCPNWRHVLLLVLVLVLCVLLPFGARAEISGQEEVAKVPCPADTVPIQIMMPGKGSRSNLPTTGAMVLGENIVLSAAEIPNHFAHPYFRAFVTAVTERINSRIAENKLCITGAESMESMRNATWEHRSLLQFVYWDISTTSMNSEYLVPAMISIGGVPFPDCQISSPWIDLDVYRKPLHATRVSQIRGIIRWNNRQLLADQAVLAGAENVPPGVAMPLARFEAQHFSEIYQDALYSRQIAAWVEQTGLGLSPPLAKQLAKPNKEHTIPPDLLWFYRHYYRNKTHDVDYVIKKGAEGYTKLVLALVDRCFAVPASDKRMRLHYTNILDVADPVLLEQYRIDMSVD